MSKKLPAFQLYPGDWRKDPGVQALDYEYRGIWFEILLLMHESDQRGKLLLNGNPMPDEALARLLGLDIQKMQKVKSTLLDFGVASINQDTGALINRRMVRDEEVRKKRIEGGKKGAKYGELGGRPPKNPSKTPTDSGRGVNRKPLKNPPSSSISISSSEEKTNAREDSGFSIPDQIQNATTAEELLPIWQSYRKEMGKHDNIYSKEVQEMEFKQMGLARLKTAMLNSMGNGWGKLVEPDEDTKEAENGWLERPSEAAYHNDYTFGDPD